jgi:beta-galactosidase
MRTCFISSMIFLAALAAILDSPAARAAEGGRRTIALDQDWRFHLGEVDSGQAADLDDSSWRRLDVPHDWSIEGPFNQASPAGAGGGYLDGGIGWYRKSFVPPPEATGGRLFVEFDGVYMDSQVWLNGKLLGQHPYGYTGFQYELTPHLKPGPNLLAVRANVTQPCSRWYSGAGIFRHVRLTATGPVHVAHWGTYVTTPKVTGDAAVVEVHTQVLNQGTALATARLQTAILDPEGVEVAKSESTATVAGGGGSSFGQMLKVSKPKLWSLQTPELYALVSRVSVGGYVVDSVSTPFGIRTIEFTRDRGFLLNGRHVPLYGVCDHHDLGCLGSAVNRRAIQRQLEILKGMGCNAIRTSHNPPAPELLDLCDRMGFVVMDEAFDEWKAGKTQHGYGRFFDQWSEPDLVSMLRRDRNHPSIVMWSIGNEIPEQGAAKGYEMSKRLCDICRFQDPTRPTVSACNDPGGADRTGFAKPLGVFGINYSIGAYQQYKGRYTLVASETASALSTRGQYNLVPDRDGKLHIRNEDHHQVTSYDLGAPGWGYTAETDLLAMARSPWVAGEFVWTGFDYIGEPTPYDWPSRSSYFGIVDLCGFPKDRYYFYRSRWRPEPLVHLLPSWDWPGWEGKPIPVWAVSNAESVELRLNGKSLGEKNLDQQKTLHVQWDVPYVPGELEALAKKGGKVVATDKVRTPGKAKRLILAADRTRIAANGDDLSFVTVRVTDDSGQTCPNADPLLRFHVEGAGTVAGTDNGDPIDHASFQSDRRKAFHGLALVVIKPAHSPGRITLRAEAEGLEPAEVVLDVGAGGEAQSLMKMVNPRIIIQEEEEPNWLSRHHKPAGATAGLSSSGNCTGVVAGK